MGLSFCAHGPQIQLVINVELAIYVCRWVRIQPPSENSDQPEKADEELTDEEGERKNERWCRVPLMAEIPITLDTSVRWRSI